MFNQLLKFKDQNFRVTSRENKPLVEWVQRQRRLHRRGQLPKTLEARLDAIGFPWIPNLSKTWSEMLAKLAAHRQATGSCDFNKAQPIDYGLKRWCTIQRKLNDAGELTREQIAALDTLGSLGRVAKYCSVAAKNHT